MVVWFLSRLWSGHSLLLEGSIATSTYSSACYCLTTSRLPWRYAPSSSADTQCVNLTMFVFYSLVWLSGCCPLSQTASTSWPHSSCVSNLVSAADAFLLSTEIKQSFNYCSTYYETPVISLMALLSHSGHSSVPHSTTVWSVPGECICHSCDVWQPWVESNIPLCILTKVRLIRAV